MKHDAKSCLFFIVQNRVTALILAAENGNDDIVHTLIQKGADVNAHSYKVRNAIFVWQCFLRLQNYTTVSHYVLERTQGSR